MKLPGRLPEAIAQYEEALRIRPDFTSAHYNLALADAKAGSYEQAVQELERVLTLDPGNASARAILDQLQGAPR